MQLRLVFSPQAAAASDPVTLTVIPDEGYTLNTLSVTDVNNKSITNNGDGTYTFAMPGQAVVVKPTFKRDPSIKVTKWKVDGEEAANPVYGTAKSADQLYKVEAVNFDPAPTLAVQWKHVDGNTTTWNTTSPDAGLSVDTDGKVTTAENTPAGDYVFRIITGTEGEDDFVASGEITLTVGRATPTVSTVPTASAITYGQTLADSALTGGTADYSDVVTAASGILRYLSGSEVEITLPAIPDGAGYGTPTKTNLGDAYTLSAISDGKITVTSTGIAEAASAMTFTVPVTADDNHNGYDITVTVTLTFKDSVTINATAESFTFGDTGKRGYSGLSVADNLVETTALSFLYESTGDTPAYSSENVPTNAGSYQVTISVPTSNTNYIGSATVAFTIAQKEITIDWAADDFTYTSQDQIASVIPSYTDIDGQEHDLVLAPAVFQNAETYTVTVSGFDTANDPGSSNYELPETKTQTYTMKKAPVTVLDVTVEDKTYNGKIDDASFTGKTVFRGVFEGDTLTLSGVTGEYASANAGSQKVTLGGTWSLSGAAKDNYRLADGGHVAYAFAQIVKAEQSAPTAPTVEGSTVTIAEADRGKKLEYSVDNEKNWVNVPALDDNGAFTVSGLDTGNHTVYLREKESSNYRASASVHTDFTLEHFSVAYHANGGVGTIASETANTGSSVTAANGGAGEMADEAFT